MGTTPARLVSPTVGLMATTPFALPGQTMLPLVSVPNDTAAKLADAAAESGSLPAELKAILHLNAGEVAAKLGAEAQKRIAEATPGELGGKLSKVVADPQALAKDPAKALQQDVGGILGGQQDPDYSAACCWSSSRAQETIGSRSQRFNALRFLGASRKTASTFREDSTRGQLYGSCGSIPGC
jgi:hypothetical protein